MNSSLFFFSHFEIKVQMCLDILMILCHKHFQGKWIYDMDPFEPLKYERPLQQLKARIAAEGSKAVFSPLLEKFLLNNAHRATIEMQV